MAHYEMRGEAATTQTEPFVASPTPLGLGAFAFTTAVLGCVYAGFIVPLGMGDLRTIAGAALFYGGIIQVLAGMWAFRKNDMIHATIFSSYGGFLVALGAIFIPFLGFFTIVGVAGLLSPVLGLFFLCWTIFTAILVLGSLRTNIALLATLVFLFLSYLFLTIGQLAGFNLALLHIGGWLGVISALIAWYTCLAHMLAGTEGFFRLPMGHATAFERRMEAHGV
jgi:succinate-acetate transporter protein